LRAALEAAYAAKPSSISRKFPWDPESLDMKTMVPMGMLVWSNLLAVMMGPIVFVCKWKANSSKELCLLISIVTQLKRTQNARFSRNQEGSAKGKRTAQWLSARVSAAPVLICMAVGTYIWVA
jgi:hypothetical protein